MVRCGKESLQLFSWSVSQKTVEVGESDGYLGILSEGSDQIHSEPRYRKQKVDKSVAGISSAELVLRSVPLLRVQQRGQGSLPAWGQ